MAFSRYDQGQVRYFHKGKVTNSTVGSTAQQFRLDKLNRFYDYDVGVIPNGYEHRPDLISNLFYGTPAFWFLILEYNNISDSFEGLNVGDVIKIPKVQ